MPTQKNYKKTLIACYLGFVTQAISANFAPLLFLTFKNTYGITLDKIAMIPMVFYLTQLLVDFAATKFADKIGYRTCVVASQVLSAVGLVLMAILPEILPVPFIGILISVVLYAIGSGLIEVLVSPIVEACPFENKDGVMSLLHSFYCWGAMGVILGSTLFFAVVGVEHWKILTFIWALVPLYNTFNFINCPIERLNEEGESMGIKKLLKTYRVKTSTARVKNCSPRCSLRKTISTRSGVFTFRSGFLTRTSTRISDIRQRACAIGASAITIIRRRNIIRSSEAVRSVL